MSSYAQSIFIYGLNNLSGFLIQLISQTKNSDNSKISFLYKCCLIKCPTLLSLFIFISCVLRTKLIFPVLGLSRRDPSYCYIPPWISHGMGVRLQGVHHNQTSKTKHCEHTKVNLE